MSYKSLAVAFLVLAFPFAVLAADIRAAEKAVIGSGEKIQGNMYVAGASVANSALVSGDQVAVGGDVLIDGATSGDVHALGGNLTILSTTGGDVRVAGGNILVKGAVKGDVVAAGGQVTVSESVGGDILWAGGELRVSAPVYGNMQLRGGDVFINGTVKGSVTFKGGSLTLGEKAIIEGNLSYTTPDKVKMEEGAVVKGVVAYAPAEKSQEPGFLGSLLSLAFLGELLMTLACAMAFGLIFNRYATTLVSKAAQQPLIELGRGFAIMVVLPVAAILLVSTFVGIPFGILGMIAWAGLLVSSWITAPILVGSLVHAFAKKSATYSVTWVTIFVGVIVYLALGFIPILGWVAKFVAALIAIGALVRMKLELAQEWR